MYKNKATNGRNNISGLAIAKLRKNMVPKTSQRALDDKMQLEGIALDKNAIQRIESYFLGKAIVHVLPPFKDKIIVSKDKMASFRMWLNY